MTQLAQLRPVQGHARLILLAVSIILLAGVVPATLIGAIPAGGRTDAWVLTLLVIVWAGVRLSLAWVAGSAKLFDFFFVLFCYVFMGIAPTAQIRSGLISTTTPDIDASLDWPTALTVWLGIAIYELVRLASGGYLLHRARPPALRKVNRGRALLLLAIGFTGSAMFIRTIGMTFMLSSRTDALAAREAAWPDPSVRSVMYALATYPLLIAIGALAQLRRYPEHRGTRGLYTALILVSTLVLLMVVNPIASARYTFGTVAFALAAYMGALATQNRRRWMLLATIFALIFLFPLADAFRTDVVSFSRTGFFNEYLSNPDYDAFWQIANAINYWLGGNVVILRQALGSLLFWVPRAFWPDKPMDTGTLLAQFRGYSFENLSAPLWAEFLVNGGIVAVMIGFALLGWFLRRLDDRLTADFRLGGVGAIVGSVFPVYMTILMRGSLLQATGSLAVSISCVLFVMGRREVTIGDQSDSPRVGGDELPSDGGHAQSAPDRLPATGPHQPGGGGVS